MAPALRSVPHHEKMYCCSPRMQLPRHEEFEGCLSKGLLSHLRHKGKQEFKLCLNPASVNSINLSLPPHTKVMNKRMATKKCCSLNNLYGEWCREYACRGRRYSPIDIFRLHVLFSQERSQGNLGLLSLHKLCVDKHVNETKFEKTVL